MAETGRGDHPYVAHYQWSASGEPPEDARARERERSNLARAQHGALLKRFRAVRYALCAALAAATIAFAASALSGIAALVDQWGAPEIVIVPAEMGDAASAVAVGYGLFAVVTLLVVIMEAGCVAGGLLLLGHAVRPRAWTILGLLGVAGAVATAAALVRDGREAEPSLAWVLAAFAVLSAAAGFELWRASWVRRRASAPVKSSHSV